MEYRLLVLSLLLMFAAPTQAQVVTAPTTTSVAGADSIEWSRDGLLHWARGRLGQLGTDIPAFLRDRAALFGWLPTETLEVFADETDADGTRHVKIRRKLSNVPVAFDQVRLHTDASGEVVTMEAELSQLRGYKRPDLFAPVEAAIMAAREGYAGPLTEPLRLQLAIVGSSIGASLPRLTYLIRIAYKVPGAIPVARDVYVDAATGVVVLSLSRVYTEGPAQMTSKDLAGATVNLNVYVQDSDRVDLMDKVTLPNSGTVLTVDGSEDYYTVTTSSVSKAFADTAAVSAHNNINTVIKAFATDYGWRHWEFKDYPGSPSTEGGRLRVVVHEGENLENAYFMVDGGWGTMAFGDGDGVEHGNYAAGLDIAAHEMAHGIVAGTADLIYQHESGAANEHFADVFGWLVDQEDDLMGEDVFVMPGSAYRHMCEPESYGQPGHMRDYQTLADSSDGDSGGVHVNSGILNHAACLTRDAIGATKVGAIWYRALSQHLGPTSTFRDVVFATLNACDEATSTTESDCDALGDSWTDVGLTLANDTSCPQGSTATGNACLCAAGTFPNDSGTACDALPEVECPPYAYEVAGRCYCERFDSNQTGCASTATSTCPNNSHDEQGSCVCDECYEPSDTDPTACEAIPNCVACDDPLATGQSGACQCIAGVAELCGPSSADYNVGCCQPDDPCEYADDGACDCYGECGWDAGDCGGTLSTGEICGGAIENECGDETSLGRCVGDTLIKCVQTDDGINFVASANCAYAIEQDDPSLLTSGLAACGFVSDALGYDCVAPETSCGTVDETGECFGDVAAACIDGLLMQLACLYGCEETLGGVVCRDCPDNATLGYDEYCYCDSGFEWNLGGNACEAADDPDDPDDNKTASNKTLAQTPTTPAEGCTGCHAAAAPSWLLLSVLWLRRRRLVTEAAAR